MNEQDAAMNGRGRMYRILQVAATSYASLAALVVIASGAPVFAQVEIQHLGGAEVGFPSDQSAAFDEISNEFADGKASISVLISLYPSPSAVRAKSSLDSVQWNNPASLRALQTEIRSIQDKVLTTFLPGEFAIKHRYENLSGFAGSVSYEGYLKLLADPTVESVEMDREFEAHTAQGIPQMRADVYRSQYNGQGLSVAICDTGVDYTHPQLGGGAFPNSKVIGGYDFGDNDTNPAPNGQAHGTSVAGIIAGDPDQVSDYIGGVAYSSKLYALKISYGTGGSATHSSMVGAWDWCLTHKNDDPDNPILIINTSFGGGRYRSLCDGASSLMTAAANGAIAAGMTHFVSSGNDGYCDSIGWPACISSVISVGAVYDANLGTAGWCVSSGSCSPNKTANSGCRTGYAVIETTSQDQVTAYSNSAPFLGIFAPSNHAYTLDISGSPGYSTGNYTSRFGGTSAASPFAAGAAAQLQSAAKNLIGRFLTYQEVREAMTSTGDLITDGKVAVTKPRVNLAAAIESIIPPPTPTPTPTPVPNPLITAIERLTPAGAKTSAATVVFRASFSESVVNVEVANFAVAATGAQLGASVASVSASSGAQIDVTVNTIAGAGVGTVRLDLTSIGSIQNGSGFALFATRAGDESYTIDRIAPTIVSITRHNPLAELTNETEVTFRVTFDEPVTNVDAQKFLVTTNGGQAGAFINRLSSGLGEVINVFVSTVHSAEGVVRLDRSAESGIADEAGNLLVAAHTGDEGYFVDRIAPAVDSIVRFDPTSEVTNAVRVTFSARFTERVRNLGLHSFNLHRTGGQSGASLLDISDSIGDAFSVRATTVSGGVGGLRLDLANLGSIQDDAGNALGTTFVGDHTYIVDRDEPEVVSIVRHNPLDAQTSAANVVYRVNFSRLVQGVNLAYFNVAGTAGQAAAMPTALSVTSGMSVDVSIATVESEVGTLRLDLVNTGAIMDELGNLLVSTHVGDETYMIDLEPRTPVNLTPATGAMNERRTLTLSASPFFDPNLGDSHGASQWQARAEATAGDYTNLAFGTLTEGVNLTSIAIPPGHLNLVTPYAWRVRYRDNHGMWSLWSRETIFTTESDGFVPAPPARPDNIFPPNAQTGVSPEPILQATDFSDPDVGDFMSASQWRVRTAAGSYAVPAYDSGEIQSDAPSHSLPPGALDPRASYFWQTRYRDSRSQWSPWSTEFSFETSDIGAIGVPSGLRAEPGATSIFLGWDAHSDSAVMGFHVYRALAEGGPFTRLTSGVVMATDYLDTGLTPGTTYFYAITAVDGQGGESSQTRPVSATVGQARITMTDMRGAPGQVVTQRVRLENPNNVGNDGLLVQIQYDAAVITPISISTTALTAPFSISDNLATANGTLVIAGVGSGPVLSGVGDMFEIAYEIKASAQLWTQSDLAFGIVELVDADANPLDIVANSDATLTIAEVIESPTVVSIERFDPMADRTKASTVVFRVTFNEKVNFVGTHNFTVATGGGQVGASVGAIGSSDGDVFDVTVDTMPGGAGIIRLDLTNRGEIQNDAGLGLEGTHLGDEEYFIDREAPEVLSIRRFDPIEEFTGATTLVFKVEFDEPVNNIFPSNFSLEATNGQTAASIVGVSATEGESFEVTVSAIQNAIGMIRLDLSDPGSIADNLSNPLAGPHQGDEAYFLDLAPNRPVNILPVAGAVGVDLDPILEASAFFDPNIDDLHQASHWQVRPSATQSDYSQVIFGSIETNMNLTAMPIGPGRLNYATSYNWRVRYQDELGVWSPWSAETEFTTFQPPVGPAPPSPPDQPVNISPPHAQEGVASNPLLRASEFSDADSGDFLTASHWRLSNAGAGFASPLYDSGDVFSTAVANQIPSGVLALDTQYEWQVRYRDSRGEWSLWSNPTTFRTVAGVGGGEGVAVPTGLAAHSGARSIRLTWDEHPDPTVTGLNLCRSENVGGPYQQLNSSLITGTEYLDAGLNPPATYYYKLSAVRGSGGESLKTEPAEGMVGVAEIMMSDMRGTPGMVVSQMVTISNAVQITNEALRIEIMFDQSVVEPIGIETTLWTSGFSFTHNAGSATDTFIIEGQATGGVIEGGGDILNLQYRVKSFAQPWTESELTFGAVALSDELGDVLVIDATDTATVLVAAPGEPPVAASILRLTPANELTNAANVIFRVSFSHEVRNVSASNFAVFATDGQTGAAISALSSTLGETIDVTVTTIDGSTGVVRLDLTNTGSIQDEYGNGLAEARLGDESYLVDRESPFVTSIRRHQPSDPVTDESTVTFRVAFSEFALHVFPAQFSVVGTNGQEDAALAGLSSEDGELVDVAVTMGTGGAGDVRVDLISPGTTTDAAGNPLLTTHTGDELYSFNVRPFAPTAVAPPNGSTNVARATAFEASAFADPNPQDTHRASQWQVRPANSPTNFSLVVFDSGSTSLGLAAIDVAPGTFEYVTAYIWRVRYQDSHGSWGPWSTPVGFTTEANQRPDRPINISPVDGGAGLSNTPRLQASEFSDPNEDNLHRASQWQLRASESSPDYSATLFDSGMTEASLSSTDVPNQLLGPSLSYMWRVRYLDNYGLWSDWSLETSFTTGENIRPDKPVNIAPAVAAEDIFVDATLKASAFSDPNADDTQAASRWQVRAVTGPADYSDVAYDSGDTFDALTSITVPPGSLRYRTAYVWRVSYQDNHGSSSEWSDETVFTTGLPPNGLGTILRTAGGELNGVEIDETRFTVFVAPGEAIVGTIAVRTNNLLAADVVAPMASTAVWGERANQIVLANAWIGTGLQNYTVEISRTAPLEEGVYPMVVAFSDMTGLANLMSNTDEALEPLWGDGNDVGFDWGETEYASANDVGAVLTEHMRSFGPEDMWLPATFVEIHVVSPPARPVNLSPADVAQDVATAPTLISSAFSSSIGLAHIASQWQVRAHATPTDYSRTVFDSGLANGALIEISIGEGFINEGTTYSWRVRHQASSGAWSLWSLETDFDTQAVEVSERPKRPINVLPPSGQDGTHRPPTLIGSDFCDNDPGDYLTAAQWRIRHELSGYDPATYDSGVIVSDLERHKVTGEDILDKSTKYYWQVRYRDSRGLWSEWSFETWFITVPRISVPSAPTNLRASGGAASVLVKWDLHSSNKVVGYNLYRADLEAGPYARLTVDPIRGNEYLDTDVARGNVYWYELTAVSDTNVESAAAGPVWARVGSIVVTMSDMRGTPGSIVSQMIAANNPNEAASGHIDVQITYDASILTPIEALTTPLTDGFALSSNAATANGFLTISADGGGVSILGEGNIIEVRYEISPNAVYWSESALAFALVELVDIGGGMLEVDFSDEGLARIEAPVILGDINGDRFVTLVDAVLLRNIIIGRADPSERQRKGGDINGDSALDSADLVLLLQMIVENNSAVEKLIVSRVGAQPAGHTLGWGGQVFSEGHIQIPITIDELSGIAGMDIVVNFDPAHLELLSAAPGAQVTDLSWQAHEQDGQLRIVMAQARAVKSGPGSVAVLTFLDRGGWQTTALNVAKFKASGERGENLARMRNMAASDVVLNQIDPTITVVSPAIGDTWKQQTTRDIDWVWTGNPGADVRVDLYRAGVLERTLIDSTPNDGSFSWSIPGGLATDGNYTIVIASAGIPTISGTSGLFAISNENAEPTIELLAPNVGADWKVGQTVEVQWMIDVPSEVTGVELELWRGQIFIKKLGETGAEDESTSLRFNVPLVEPGDDYYVLVVSRWVRVLWDQSDAFISITRDNAVRAWEAYE